MNCKGINRHGSCRLCDAKLDGSKLDGRFGRYYMAWLYNYAIVQGEKWLDVADYYGPVEVSNLTAAGKGKGQIAQRRIKKGTLLG